MTIPFSRPYIGEEEIDRVREVFYSNWLTVGETVHEFEEALKQYLDAEYVVALDSCTSALTLSLKALSLMHGCRDAIVPALTFIATANAAYHAGYNIKFQDVDYDGNLNAKICDPADVIIPVHFAGQVCDLDAISELSTFTVEDAAHAIGAKYGGRSVGTFDTNSIACFSFYPTKNMTTIEGGAVVTMDEDIADLVRTLSLHGLGTSHETRYQRSSLAKPTAFFAGYKANMTNIEAAVGLIQLKRLDSFNERRKNIAKIYHEELKGKLRFLDTNGNDHVYHMMIGLVDNRNTVIEEGKIRGVGFGIHYSPIIPEHPFYKELTNYKKGQFPVAEYIAEHCISLPLYNDITLGEVEHVIKVVKGVGMKFYAEVLPKNLGKVMYRINENLKRFAPEWATFVDKPEAADIQILDVIGDGSLKELKCDKYILLQHCLESSDIEDRSFWIPVFSKALLVASYLNLYSLVNDESFSFYRTPWGADPELFSPGNVEKKFLALSTGHVASTETIEELYDAVKWTNGELVHVGHDFKFGVNFNHREDITDLELVNLYRQCKYVSGLRKMEGYELPIVEGIFCRTRGICYNREHYKFWYGDLVEYIEEDDYARIGLYSVKARDQLLELFKKPYREVTEEELTFARNKFSWEVIMNNLWKAIEKVV